MDIATQLAERRLVPDRLIRTGIRNLLRKRLEAETARAARGEDLTWTRAMARSPVALATEEANAQHYEVPAAFYREVLGPYLKYSSGYWPEGVNDLGGAERAMLELTVERAGLADGQRILELGCGWGSLSLFMARRFPNAHIVSVSNSRSQRAFIESEACESGLTNLSVITADVNAFATDQRFERVVSVEMFEHVRNWEALLARIHGWLEPEGLVFLHFFAHRSFAYPFESVADDDWMGRHFFTGGMMPSKDLLSRLALPFEIEGQWDVNGTHYARTTEAWLANLDQRRAQVTRVFSSSAPAEAERMVQRWRIFFMACAELFGFAGGNEWLVEHALLRPRREGAR